MNHGKIHKLAKILWDYHRLGHEIRPSQAMLVLGSHDLRVADHAAELYHRGFAPRIVFSGGFGNLTKGVWKVPEANLFAERARDLGVPEESLLLENRSTNTGENIRFTRDLLRREGIEIDRFLLVQKPYMERRAYATFRKQWPEKECQVTSPSISFEEYPTPEIPFEKVVNIMVGDLQRIRLYPERNFQIEQSIPERVWSAFLHLVELGFNEHLCAPVDVEREG